MARSLRSLLEPVSPYPSTSIVDASGISPAERRAADERWWEERKRRESGAVTSGFDPGVFEWMTPSRGGPRPSTRPSVILQKTTLIIRGFRELEQWVGKKVEIGFTDRAIAFRLSQHGEGWSLTKTPKASSPSFRMVMSKQVWAEIERRGFPVGQPLPARWDERSQMVVAVRPAEDKKAQRRAG